MDILDKTGNLTRWLASQIDDLDRPADNRDMITAGCYDITLEHQRSIALLVGESCYGSAFALAKSVFESYVRGVWLQYCASDTEFTHFKKGKFDLSMGQMISRIEELEGYSDKVLTAMKQSGWASLNQYSHSGILQIARRAAVEDGHPAYSETDISELLDFVNNIAILAAMEMVMLAGHQDIEAFLDKIREYHRTSD